jgi:DNA adenine methylase
MQYLGGKSRTYKEICAFLEAVRKPNQPFVEPFCGACWITQGMTGTRYAADANEALIAMWKALQQGWEPPSELSEDAYVVLKTAQDLKDPITAFAGFGCSFGGKWFGGYARSNERNYASNARNSIVKKRTELQNVKFSHRSYDDVLVKDCLIYCDPPYASTTGYGAVGQFDSDKFWQTVRNWINSGNTVVVSEYVAPDDFICVKSIVTKTDMHTKSGKEPRIEKLFMHESQIQNG